MNRRDAETQSANEITEKIIGCAIEEPRHLGPRLLGFGLRGMHVSRDNRNGLAGAASDSIACDLQKGSSRLRLSSGCIVVLEFKTVEKLLSPRLCG